MRFILSSVAVPFLALSLVACSSTGPINEPTELVDIENPSKVKRLWKASTSSSDLNLVYDHIRPVLVDDLLYSVSAKGIAYAFDRQKGKQQWKSDLDVVISAGVGVNAKALFVGTSKGELLALDRNNGEVLWRQRLSSEIMSQPVATSSLVVVRCGDGSAYGLDTENGNQVWHYPHNMPALTLRGESVPVIVDGTVLLGTADGRLVALSIYDGSVSWESALVVAQGRTDLERMVDVDATPVVADGTVYSVAHQGRVVALSLLTGVLQWSRDIGSSAGLTVDAHHVYVVDDEDQVWALDRRNGASLWKQDQLKFRSVTAPARIENAVVVGDFEGYLHWLSLDDGKIFARHQVHDDGVRVAPIVLDNTLYVRSKVGKLEALSLVE
ncbi:outer membrane protein assembly factor BamB [Pseudomonadota bacterium]